MNDFPSKPSNKFGPIIFPQVYVKEITVKEPSMKKGTIIKCIDAIEGYLTNGKEYESQGIESYAGRVVITDDNGREGHFKPERFVEVKNENTVSSGR